MTTRPSGTACRAAQSPAEQRWSGQPSARAVGRLISSVENGEPVAAHLLSASGQAHVVGITGPSGVGKSTLVDKLIDQVRGANRRVAVLAVDPSSPFTGGAILGDRVRMNRHAADSGVFIRSMAARHALGGLAATTRDAVNLLDRCDFDVILVETVGVGQNEVEIVRTADTVIVLAAPGLGDSVQTLKAGILEIADILVVNMADRPGASQTVAELRSMLGLTYREPTAWEVPLLETIATGGEGIDQLWAQIERHRQHAIQSGSAASRRVARSEAHVFELVLARLRERFSTAASNDPALRHLIASVQTGALSAHQAATAIVDTWLPEETHSM